MMNRFFKRTRKGLSRKPKPTDGIINPAVSVSDLTSDSGSRDGVTSSTASDTHCTDAERFIRRMTAASLIDHGYNPSPYYNSKKEYVGAPFPRDEVERLAKVKVISTLDGPCKEHLNRLTNVIKTTFKVPIVLVSLVCETKQWFECGHGLGAVDNTDRTLSFCAWTLLPKHPEILEVIDAREHSWFKDNALVTGAPHIVAYTGAPLVSASGTRYGSLCCIDVQPRKFSSSQIRQLQNYAGLVVQELEKGLKERSNAREEIIFQNYVLKAMDTFADGMLLVAEANGVLIVKTANKGWEHITQYTPEESLAKDLLLLLTRDAEVRKDIEDMFLQESCPSMPQSRSPVPCCRKDGTSYFNHIRIFRTSRSFQASRCVPTVDTGKHWIVQVTDMTEYEDAKKGLTSAVRELAGAKAQQKDAIKQKSAFLANMSHELRTPLNSIIACSELLRIQAAYDAPSGEISPPASSPNVQSLVSVLRSDKRLSEAEVRRRSWMSDRETRRRSWMADRRERQRSWMSESGTLPDTGEGGRRLSLLEDKEERRRSFFLEDEYCVATTIHNEATQLLTLMDDVLNFSKLEAQDTDTVEEPLLIAPWMDRYMAWTRTNDAFRGLSIGYTLELQTLHKRTIYVNRTYVEQVLKNLLSNICKYAEDGEVILRVKELPSESEPAAVEPGKFSEGAQEGTANLLLEIQATDISPERCSWLLEAESRGQGGVRFIIVRHLVQQKGGDFSMHKHPEKGMIFAYKLGLSWKAHPQDNKVPAWSFRRTISSNPHSPMSGIDQIRRSACFRSGLSAHKVVVISANACTFYEPLKSFCSLMGVPCEFIHVRTEEQRSALETALEEGGDMDTFLGTEDPMGAKMNAIAFMDEDADLPRVMPESRRRTASGNSCSSTASTARLSRSLSSNMLGNDLERKLQEHPRVFSVTRYLSPNTGALHTRVPRSPAHSRGSGQQGCSASRSKEKTEVKPVTFKHVQTVMLRIVNQLILSNLALTSGEHRDRGFHCDASSNHSSARSPRSSADSTGNPDYSGAHTLIVDDVGMNLMVLQKLLASLGITRVDKAMGALEARALMLKNKYNLVFMDVQMPDIDGFTASRMLREDNKDHNFKLVGITACTETSFFTLKCQLAGMDAVVYKPIRAQHLANVLERFNQSLKAGGADKDKKEDAAKGGRLSPGGAVKPPPMETISAALSPLSLLAPPAFSM